MNKIRAFTMTFSLVAIIISVYSMVLSSRVRSEIEAHRFAKPAEDAKERETELAWSTCMKIMLEGGYAYVIAEDTCKIMLKEDQE